MKNDLLKVKRGAAIINRAPTTIKNNVISDIAKLIVIKANEIFKQNNQDIENAKNLNLPTNTIDRLMLDKRRLDSIIESLESIITLDDPVMKVEKGFKRPNGLEILRVRVPIGVICIIYESRPNVTVDAAALCIKSGNAVDSSGRERSSKYK